MRPALRKLFIGLIAVFALTALLAAPAGAVIEAEEAFRNVRSQADQAVANGLVNRTWIWGPEPISGLVGEAYREHPTDERPVMYWDKSRMEINDPNSDSTSPWYVTNGLLARELMTGMMQFGHTAGRRCPKPGTCRASLPAGSRPPGIRLAAHGRAQCIARVFLHVGNPSTRASPCNARSVWRRFYVAGMALLRASNCLSLCIPWPFAGVSGTGRRAGSAIGR